jgi:alkylhydroperoxidase family enzyme
VEFLRVASGEAATPLAVLQRDDESLAPRARTLARLAVTLTAEPWAVTPEAVRDAARQGLSEEQIEAAVGVISMFNYFTRVADATGIEFDYETPLPAFRPEQGQFRAARPDRSGSSGSSGSSGRQVGKRPEPQHPRLQAAWKSWRAYVLDTEEPISRRERRLLACVAAEEAADWEGAAALDGGQSRADGDDRLIGFARKLSRQPWRMEPADLEGLRAAGYSEEAVLHVISVVAHQNADSRLVIGLGALGR